MKRTISKIILFTLIAVMLFGSLNVYAFESYDTYTYSIDGEPLKSPAAYTPDFTTYDSEAMGLLGGNFWGYNEGEIGIWEGNAMHPITYGFDFKADGLQYTLNEGDASTEEDDTYTVVGFTDEFIAGIDSSSLELVSQVLIPEHHNGKPVVAIAADAFTASDPAKQLVYAGIKNLFISSSVKTVGDGAFVGTAMEKVFYGGESASEWDGENNIFLKSLTTTLYYYSSSIKYGNSALKLAGDLVSDKDGNLYVVDKEANRVVVLNKRDFKVIGVMGKYTDEYGNEQSFKNPSGVFVTNSDEMVESNINSKNYKGGIFVCDTDNKRIVVFNHDFEYMRTIEEPSSALLDNDDFQLNAIAVDIYGRIFAISHNCHEGVMVLSSEGDFTGFIGAQKVTVDPIQQLWNKYFKTAEQRLEEAKELPVPFNNITVDQYGFVYVTINFTEPDDLANQALSMKEKTAAYSPIKKLNSTGVEIMKRNGFFDPGGEVIIDTVSASKGNTQLSKIIDVAIGNEGSWSLLDSIRSRIFTYDSNGNLLFAFGDNGDQVGNGENYVAMTYQILDGEYNLVLLDNTGTGYKIIVYHPTKYCDAIMSALHNENIHNHQASIDDWQEVLKLNNNFDLAYIGMGKALFNLGEEDEAMKMLSSAYETDYYSKAFAEKRKEILSVWMIPMIIGIIVLLVLFFKFLGFAKKKNKATSLKVGRKSYLEELIYVFHLVFHPFDGFWDLKHEKRGSVRAGTTILGLTIIAFFYQAIGQGYMFNPRGDYSTVFLQVIAVLVPVLLWVISNWCLTTLFDGEGSLKDIYIATTYSLAPLPLFVIISTILSNVFTVSEGSMVTLLVTIGYVWVALLLFFGMSVTHDYSMGKNVITILGTIVAMAVIMFIAILFSSLVIKMVTFIVAICTEIFNRF